MGKKLFIAPVFGVELTEYVNNEFQILRTLLVSNEKLRRNRKKFGISEQISKLPQIQKELFFDACATFAIVIHNSNRNDDTLVNESLQIIQKELSILSLSCLYSERRGEFVKPTVMNPSVINIDRYSITKIDNNELSGRVDFGALQRPHRPLTLGKNWFTSQKEYFFLKLLTLIKNQNKKYKFNKDWIEIITKASILIGKSINSNDLEHAFLWNMIALEILLTNSNDSKFLDILPRRIEAFFGWYNNWKTEGFEKKIEEIYSKRCKFVHRAIGEDITVEDLLFTDSLLFNLLNNIASFPNLFSRQEDVINFSHKIEAQKTLKINRKPIGLKFIRVRTNNDEIKKFFGR